MKRSLLPSRWFVKISERAALQPRSVARHHGTDRSGRARGFVASLAAVLFFHTLLVVGAPPVTAQMQVVEGKHIRLKADSGTVESLNDLVSTFDAAVLRKQGDDFVILGEPEGIERLGGIDFDAAVIAHVRNEVGADLDALAPNDPAAARLRAECVSAKEALSADLELARNERAYKEATEKSQV